jgi:hypothetical protein
MINILEGVVKHEQHVTVYVTTKNKSVVTACYDCNNNPHTNRLVHKVLLQVLRVCTNVVQVSRIVAQGVGARAKVGTRVKGEWLAQGSRVNGWHKGQG